jgi:uridine phosphorylase
MVKHIGLSKEGSDYRKVLVCGSPERALFLSTKLEGAKALAKNREYHSYSGHFQGQNILVMSHGVGSAGAAICFQELVDVGAEVILRLGTAGGLYEETKAGDVLSLELRTQVPRLGQALLFRTIFFIRDHLPTT